MTISVSCFIPKPFTPFQWEAQDSLEILEEKQRWLRDAITDRKIRYTWHDARVSRIDAVFARETAGLPGLCLREGDRQAL